MDWYPSVPGYGGQYYKDFHLLDRKYREGGQENITNISHTDVSITHALPL